MKTNQSGSAGTAKEAKSLPSRLLTLPERQSDGSLVELEAQLRERIKELDCLYRLTNLIEQHGGELDKILQDTVELLPVSWQYPEFACARIRYQNQVFTSANFKKTQWRQESPIIIYGNVEGRVEVRYLKKLPDLDEGPFLKEERLLIDAVSSRIARAAERIDTQKQLQLERQALQDANAALHDALVQSQKEKKMLGLSIQSKVDKIISPIFYALQAASIPSQLEYLMLLKKNLDDIIAPFAEGDNKTLAMLSPVELQISNMIKHGFSTKEIAKVRGISPSTVNRHRESIRRKLGITNSKVNLVAYLSRP
jgi:DNA-binding CsgD family transcriptional regulator